MSQTNNGQQELTVDSRLKEVEAMLDAFDKSVGLSYIKFNADVESILQLRLEELRSLDETDCGSFSYCLAQYSSFLQKEINRHSAKLKWANHNLDIIVAKVYNNYGDKYMKADTKRSLVINDDSYAKALNKIVLETTLRIEELSFLSSRINVQSEILRELQKTKRAEKYERS